MMDISELISVPLLIFIGISEFCEEQALDLRDKCIK